MSEGEKIPYLSGHYNGGLCGVAYNSDLIDKILLSVIEPTIDNAIEFNISRTGFWGYDSYGIEYATKFTELRQNIVLFMAAMNNEL